MGDWKTTAPDGLEMAIVMFKEALPGWWYSVGECQVSADASCGPTRESGDIDLIPLDSRFDSGFHADLPQPATMAGMAARSAGVYLKARRLAEFGKSIVLDRVNAVPHKVAIRSIVTAFVGDSKVTKSEIEQALLSIEAAVKGFHTMKGLRAWASEENLALKRSALALIAELQEKIGEGA